MGDPRAEQLRHYLVSNPRFDLQPRPVAWGGHLGAIVADTALQANRDYERTVEPRIQALVGHWPDATTTSTFLHRCGDGDPVGTLASALRWNGRVRPQRALAIAEALQKEGVETADDCSRRFQSGAFDIGQTLRAIRGVGPKSVAYLSGLVGHPDVAVDVRLKRVLADAGVAVEGFDDARAVISGTAHLLEVDRWVLDGAMWQLGGRTDRQS